MGERQRRRVLCAEGVGLSCSGGVGTSEVGYEETPDKVSKKMQRQRKRESKHKQSEMKGKLPNNTLDNERSSSGKVLS